MRSKQVLFIQPERGAKNRLFFRNENVVFEKNGQIVNQASCHRVLAVFVIGDFSFTSGLIREAKKRGLSLFFLNQNFRCYAAFSAKADGNYLLRSIQYNAVSEKETVMAKNLIKNKVSNQCALLRALKNPKGEIFSKIISQIASADDVKEILGMEGSASKQFFREYFSSLGWIRRSPRTKPDIPNFLMDMGYTLLFNFVDSLLLLFGFDTYKGFYHQLFFQRKSLVCDIVEPFRCVIDRQILKSYNLKQINRDDFSADKNGKISLSYDKSQKYARIFMEAIMDSKEAIYIYIQKYYQNLMKGKNDLPYFDIVKGEVK